MTASARVLVVEDEPRIAHFLGKALRLDGHEVVVAEDGEVALFLGLTEEFDLAVLDLTLPGRSGLEVLVELHRERPGLPVLMLTGRDDAAARRAAGSSRPVSMTTGSSERARCSSCSTDSPERPGSVRSSTATSKGSLRARNRPTSPSSATTTSCPSRRSALDRNDAMRGSSSTTSTRAVTRVHRARAGTPCRAGC